MPNYKEEGPQASTFQNRTDQQDRRTAGGDSAESISAEQLVRRFKSYVAQQQEQNRAHNFDTSPEHIIREKLDWESGPAHTDPQTRTQALDFWRPLILAWDALAYDRYDPKSLYKTFAKNNLWTAYEITTKHPQREPAIQLTPYQARILDGLTEAAGIHHQKGQTAITIPENARTVSKEYEQNQKDIWLDMCIGAGAKWGKR